MQFQRQVLLIGEENYKKLNGASVIVFGVGGVGGFTVEALVRAGIGKLSVVDFDTVDITNLNRQVIATHNSVGKVKVDLIKERALSINPNLEIKTYQKKFSHDTQDIFFQGKQYDYIVDAIDLVSCKLSLIERAKKDGIPIISSMGTGNKLDPTKFEVSDISKTSVCPLAKVMRRELKNRGIKKVKVVYSKEQPKKPENKDGGREKNVNVGSISFVPSVAGLIIAGEVIKDICDIRG